jgi:hypothetical protein
MVCFHLQVLASLLEMSVSETLAVTPEGAYVVAWREYGV